MPVQLFQFDATGEQKIFHSEFEKLIERERNNKVKSILTSEFARTPPSSIADSCGLTLLHLAAKYDNANLIRFLVKSGCEVDVKNVLGETPLFTAVSFERLYAIEALTCSDADIWINDTNRVLRLLIAKRSCNLPVMIIVRLMRKIITSIADLETIAALFLKVRCPLNYVVYADDSRLTEMMLNNPAYRINYADAYAALLFSVKQSDLENLRVLWRSVRMVYSRSRLLKIINTHRNLNVCATWKYTRPMFRHLTDWMVLNEEFNLCLYKIFSVGSMQDFQLLLEEYNVDVQIRQKYKFDVVPVIFRNERLNIEDLSDLAYKRLTFNVNAKSFEGMSSLHYAALRNSADKIRILLRLGANSNIKDRNGCTPLFHPRSAICFELLLQSGADIHVVLPTNGKTVAEEWLTKSDSDISKVMLAQLAIDYHRCVPIRQATLDIINGNMTYKCYYDNCLMQVKHMMYCRILSSLTLFSVIAREPPLMANQIRSREMLSSIVQRYSQRSLNSYYRSFLQQNSENAYTIYRAKCRAAAIISETLSIVVNFDNSVVETVSDYLSLKDMDVFLSVYETTT